MISLVPPNIRATRQSAKALAMLYSHMYPNTAKDYYNIMKHH
jgi:hypothetical protein